MSLGLFLRCTLGAFALASLFVATSAAQAPVSVAAVPPREQAALDKIEAALARQVSVEYEDTALKDIIAEEAKQAKITIVLSKKIEDAGVQPDQPVTVKLRELSLDSALSRILADLNLTIVVKNEMVVITTTEDAQSPENLLTKIYPVADLVINTKTKTADFDPIIDLVTSTIEPDAWQDVGGPGSIQGHDPTLSLVFRNRRDLHQKMEGLLAALRKVRELQKLPVAAEPTRTISETAPVPPLRLPTPVAPNR